jgi:sugar phosphate permease
MDGMHVALLVSSASAAVVGVFAVFALRDVPKEIPESVTS